MKGSNHFNFHKLWLGQSISLLGTQFTIVALPLFALEVLQTSEANAAILRGVIFVPYLIFGLVTGALIDIFHRKNILLICSICQEYCFISIHTDCNKYYNVLIGSCHVFKWNIHHILQHRYSFFLTGNSNR